MNHSAVDAAAYEAWYHTPRGEWIAGCELRLMLRLLQPAPGASLLDVGAGTGHFSRRFAAAGLVVTGVEPDAAMLARARALDGGVRYLEGRAEALPFPDRSFDHVAAVTSLCFVSEPARALAEMWRVARKSVLLGLLNRHSLLYLYKKGRGGYAGARWDTTADVCRWIADLDPAPATSRHGTAVHLPTGGPLARRLERWLPPRLGLGAFLAVVLEKPRIP